MEYSLISLVLPILQMNSRVQTLLKQYVDTLSRLEVASELIAVTADPVLAEALETIIYSQETVRIHVASQNRWGVAVREGLRAAKGDLLCYTYLQSTRPEDLHLVLSLALSNPGTIIKTNRRVSGNWLRRLGGALYTAECRWLFDLPLWDINASPKAFPRIFDRLLELQSEDSFIETEFCVVCRQERYPMLQIPVDLHRDFIDLSVAGWWEDLSLYWRAFQLYRALGDRSTHGSLKEE